MLSLIKESTGKILHRLGYEIRRISDGSEAFRRQIELCSGVDDLVIFDVGAYHGEVTRQYRKFSSSARIYAFEPFAESFAILQKNLAEDKNSVPFNLGLADCKGIRRLRSNALAATNSLLNTHPEVGIFWDENALITNGTSQTHFSTIDDFTDEQGIEKIDILKLDVQGAEDVVLRGGEKLIATGSIRMVYMEILVVPTYQGQKKLHESLKLMDSLGFTLHSFHDQAERNGRLLQLDALFLGSRLS
jgi:FkbM family methyltransferase